MKTLIIAEKPDMGRNIAAAIEPQAINNRNYLEGPTFIITWAIGHLISLAEPDKYDNRYKKWRLGDLPIIPEIFKLLPNERTKSQLAVIAELSQKCDHLVNACDAGREGQHIFSLIQRHLKLRQPVKRLWISDLTPETIRHGFANLRDGADYENLTKAAKARSEADWLVGMNATRAFTSRHNVLLSVGRVQTPVLALIYNRQLQIDGFDSNTYYEVEAVFSQEAVNYRGSWQGEKLTKPEQASAIVAKVQGKEGSIISCEIKDSKEYPYKLFDLTLLQRESNGKFGFSAKKTLDLAQALYEKHKVISYPRTNSNYVTEQNIIGMHRSLDSLKGTLYDPVVRNAKRNLVHKDNKSICNPAKVEDHHAILPTHKKASGLTSDEQKIYDLIVRRFLSHFYLPAEYKLHTVLTEIQQETFKTNVKQLIHLGWKAIYQGQDQVREQLKDKKKGRDKGEEHEEEISSAFSVNPLAAVDCIEASMKEKETQPPKHFTEGTLLKAMESAGKKVEDDELREAMKDAGLGTPATRAATIERLKQVEYIDLQGKKVLITAKGRTVIDLIRSAGVELLTSPEMTGHWERRLSEIAKGIASDTNFMDNVKNFTTLIVDKVRLQPRAAKEAFIPLNSKTASKTSSKVSSSKKLQTRESITTCPRLGCGGQIFMGNKGYGCSHYKEGCTFVIWKSSFGKALTPKMVKSLIEKGTTNKLKLTNEAGQVIDAKIVLKDMNTGQLIISDDKAL